MIRAAVVGNALGKFLVGLALFMLVPLGVGLLEGDDPRPMAWSCLITASAGLILTFAVRPGRAELSTREGFLLAVLVWIGAFAAGALPFWFSSHFPTFTDAFFESVSGFTTTGSTVLAKVEVLQPSVQLWRHGTHWFGGMGILLLVIAILPLLGAGGVHLYRAEFSGAKSEKLKPRITETAFSLWRIYVALTLAEYVALRLAGMGAFESACHSFSTLGTGGFSTRTASVAGFENPAIEYIIIVFMMLAGINFTRQYRLWVQREPRAFSRDPEVRAFLAIIAGASALVFGWLMLDTGYEPARALRTALFQVCAVLTTTGFVTDDFARWAPFPQLLLLSLMFIGGSTGSTAGGLKVARVLTLFKVVGRESKRLVERRGVFAVRLGGHVVPEDVIQSTLNIFYLAFAVNFAASLLLTATGLDLVTSISAVAASMFNVGPGLAAVGPAAHYGHLPAAAKWVLIFCMFAGRLEFYTVLVLCTPAFWRK
ncbi:MAG TPA: potassium transporter TrkG [Bryobacteraceae bacterium]|nr:potassium transporter TrkG [Bryobacteraceae bacterium]